MHPFAREEIQRTYVDVEDVMPRLRYEGPHRKGIEVADFYGFRLIPQVKIEKTDRESKGPEERVALIRHYLEHGLDTCTPPVRVCHTAKIPYKQQLQFKLDVIGTEKSIAETLLIYTTLAILKEYGFSEDLSLALNSIGGRNSTEAFLKELTTHCREYMNELDDHCRQALKENPFEVFACENEQCRDILDQGPQSVAFLSDVSRKHFYDILETLEALTLPYEIDSRLVGNQHTTSHTVFEIRHKPASGEEASKVIAEGERYDYVARKSGLGRHVPAVGVTITLDTLRSTRETIAPYKITKNREHRIYIIQLGLEAKRSVLHTIELLRKADIQALTLLTEDKLAEQLALAKNIEAPIIVIIGYQEVLDGTAIVRDQETRYQVSIPREELPRYLKKLGV